MAIQVAGEQYYDLDGQLAEIKRQLRQPSGYPFDPNQLKVALQDAIEGKFPETKPKTAPPFFSIIATTQLTAIAGKKTKDCFTDKSRYAYRDSDLDNWLPKDQKKASACTIATLALKKDWTFAEAAIAVLDIGAGMNIKTMGEALIGNGHTMTLAQAEEMVEATERGDKTKMRTDGFGNFFFVETGREEDPVSVGDVIRGGRVCCAFVRRLGSDYRWRAGRRLLVRNLDTSKL